MGSALILFALDVTFVMFLLTPIPVGWDPLFDLEVWQDWNRSERTEILSDRITANSTMATGSAQHVEGDYILDEMIQYDVTVYVELLVLVPFMVAAYLLYLGISGVLFYRRWDEKYQIYLQKTKSLEAELDDIL